MRLPCFLARSVFPVTAAFLALATALLRGAPVPDEAPVGWWRDATFYEIFVRSFADAQGGPLAGDGIGDLQGLIDHLDYLNDGGGPDSRSLGINAVWLMPIQPSPSYHGYDVTDYFAVNPQYGDVPLLKRLVAEAHRRGIRVIVDLVLNHCSSRHPLFKAALAESPGGPTRQLFRFAPEPEQPAGPWGDPVWRHVDGDGYYYAVFSPEMPDWNLENPKVTEHHRRCAEFWLREIGVDGFRLDAVRYFIESGNQTQDTEETREWLRGFAAYCHTVKPGAFVIGEDTGDMREIAEYIRGDSLDSAFEFDLARATIDAVANDRPALLKTALRRLNLLYDGGSPWSCFLTNHDQDRILSQLHNDPAKMRLAAKLLFTEPGVPFVYYGEEIGMTGTKPDPEIRTPMAWSAAEPNAGFTSASVKPWHTVTGDFRTDNVAAEEADPQSLLSLYRHLIRMNAASPALRHGRTVPLATNDRGGYAVMRESEYDATLIIANFDAVARQGPVVSISQSSIRPDWGAAEVLSGTEIHPPKISAEGGFESWTPLAKLAPDSVYVIRWTARLSRAAAK